MDKKRGNEPLDKINAAYDAIFNDVVEMPLADVQRALADVGVDREQLRAALHEKATELARQLRARGESAPPFLQRLLDQSADASELPAHPQRALEKATQYLTNLLGSVPTSTPPQIVGAFRGEGDLTAHDQQTIEEIDEELRRRAETEGENGDPET